MTWKWCCQVICEGTFHMFQAGKVSFFFFLAVPHFPKITFLYLNTRVEPPNPKGGSLRGMIFLPLWPLMLRKGRKGHKINRHFFQSCMGFFSQLITAAAAFTLRERLMKQEMQLLKRCKFKQHALNKSSKSLAFCEEVFERICIPIKFNLTVIILGYTADFMHSLTTYK